MKHDINTIHSAWKSETDQIRKDALLADLNKELIKLAQGLAHQYQLSRDTADLHDFAQNLLLGELGLIGQPFEGRNGAKFSTYVVEVFRHAFIKLKKIHKREQPLLIVEENDEKSQPTGMSEHPYASRNQYLASVREAFDRLDFDLLSPQQRIVVEMFLEEMTDKEIGDELGISDDRVYRLRHAAIEVLKAGVR